MAALSAGKATSGMLCSGNDVVHDPVAGHPAPAVGCRAAITQRPDGRRQVPVTRRGVQRRLGDPEPAVAANRPRASSACKGEVAARASRLLNLRVRRRKHQQVGEEEWRTCVGHLDGRVPEPPRQVSGLFGET